MVARPDVRDSRSDGFDDTGCLVAEHDRDRPRPCPSTTERSEWQSPAAATRTWSSADCGGASSSSSIESGRDSSYGRARPISRRTAARVIRKETLSREG